MQVLFVDCLPRRQNSSDDSPQYRLHPHDLQQLPLSCPNLQQLDLRGRIHGDLCGTELKPLLQLAGSLTSLSLGCDTYDVSDDALGIICQLTRLECLMVGSAIGVSDVGLLSLSKLRQLRELQICHLTTDMTAVSEALAPKSTDGRREIKLLAKVGHAFIELGRWSGNNRQQQQHDCRCKHGCCAMQTMGCACVKHGSADLPFRAVQRTTCAASTHCPAVEHLCFSPACIFLRTVLSCTRCCCCWCVLAAQEQGA
jgi:hypothetical protein